MSMNEVLAKILLSLSSGTLTNFFINPSEKSRDLFLLSTGVNLLIYLSSQFENRKKS
ncbi:hypothetical protein [Petroclostridium sp. X23]|uniref:hypothetical protein n=1 Tax=Petroclostridium sp. X23 TaxID=3045146 RepID=UPI0024AD4EE4|nr:hypothetical protein [Petroclostridium sp. X23]WHH61026.1 hypothetical protein QKW49_10095 [Petroclostridium sp. X23]